MRLHIFLRKSYERFVHDCISREKYAYSQGEKRGIQMGLQQGGHNARLETARRMLLSGKLSIAEIADIAELSISEVEALK